MVQALSTKARHFLIAVFASLAILRFWFAWHFNPYWGYDGGGHLEYIFSLASGHWPSIATNYIAWHEPLYYLILAPVWKLFGSLKALSLAQALLSLAVAWLSWLVIEKLTDKPWARALAWLTWNLLPPVFLASTFVTNELLNYFWILLIMYSGLVVISRPQAEKSRDIILLGLICGLALLTKITAIVAIGALLLSFPRKRESVIRVLAVAIIAILMYLPWLTHRGELSVNNTSYLAPAPLALDSRITFFLKFDTDIFKFPFWYSGGNGFWSMLYADTFWDYYAMIRNPDVLANMPAYQKTPTNHNGGEVSLRKFQATNFLPWIAIPLALIMLIGAYQLARKPFELPTLITAGLFAALIYFSYRYPFYDRGIVKSIFIGPAYLPLLAAGYARVEKYRWLAIFPIIYSMFLLKSMTLG